MAELIGVTDQQAHKYETAFNQIAAGRLYQIALALGVEICDFFMDADPDGAAQIRVQEIVPQQRLSLVRNFTLIESRKHQGALCQLAQALNDRD